MSSPRASTTRGSAVRQARDGTNNLADDLLRRQSVPTARECGHPTKCVRARARASLRDACVCPTQPRHILDTTEKVCPPTVTFLRSRGRSMPIQNTPVQAQQLRLPGRTRPSSAVASLSFSSQRLLLFRGQFRIPFLRPLAIRRGVQTAKVIQDWRHHFSDAVSTHWLAEGAAGGKRVGRYIYYRWNKIPAKKRDLFSSIDAYVRGVP